MTFREKLSFSSLTVEFHIVLVLKSAKKRIYLKKRLPVLARRRCLTMAAVNLDTFKKGEKWRAYVEQLNSFIQLKDIPADKQKDFLITQLSTPVYEILCGLCKPDSPQHPKFGFDDLIKKLDDFLTPPDKYVAHFEYNREKQGIQETIKEYKFTEQLSEGVKTEAMCFKVYRSADSIKDFVNFTAEVDWDHNESTKHITTSDLQSNAEVFTVSEFRCLQQQQNQQHPRTEQSMRATMLDNGKFVDDACCCCRDNSSTASQKHEEPSNDIGANDPTMLEPAHLTSSSNGYPNSSSSSAMQTGLRMSSSCAAIKSSGSYTPLHQPNRSLPLRPAPPLPRRRSSSIAPPQQSGLDKSARNNKDAPSNRGSPFSTESLLRCDDESSTRQNWSRIDQQPPNASEPQQQPAKMVPPLKLKKLSREDDHHLRGSSIEREETSTPSSSSVGEYCIITPERSDQQQQHSAQSGSLASEKTASTDCGSSDHDDCTAKSIEIMIPSMPELGINEQRTDRISVPQESAKPFIVKYTIANDGQFSRLMPINFQPVPVVQTSPIANKLADPVKSDKLEHDQNSNLISSMPIISHDSRSTSRTHSKPIELTQTNSDWHKRKHRLRDKLRDHLASVLESRRKLSSDQENEIEECEERIERFTDLLKKLSQLKAQESFDKFCQEDIEESLRTDEEKCDERRDDTSITESSNDEVFSELQHLEVKVSSMDAGTNRDVTTNSGIKNNEVVMDNKRTTMNLEKSSANGYIVNSSSPRSVIVDARPNSNSVGSPASMPTKPKGYSSFMIEELTATAHQPTAVRSQQQHQACLPLNSPREALIASTAWLGNEHQQHQPQLNSMTDVVAQSYTYNRVLQQSQMMQEESKKFPCKRAILDDVSVGTSPVDKKKKKKVNEPAAPPMSQWPTSAYMQTHAPYNKAILNNLQLQRMHNRMNNSNLRYPVSSADVGLWSPAIMVYPHNEIHSQQQKPINEQFIHRVVDYKIMDQQQQAQAKTARPLQEYQQQMSNEFVMNVHRARESEQQLRHEAAKRSLQPSKTQLMHHQNSISHESSTPSRVIPDPFVNLNHWAVIEMSKKNADMRKNGSIVLPDNRQSYFQQSTGGMYKGGPVDLVNNNFANGAAGHWAVVAAEQQQVRAASYHQQQHQQQQQQQQTPVLATSSSLYRRQPTNIPNYSSKLGSAIYSGKNRGAPIMSYNNLYPYHSHPTTVYGNLLPSSLESSPASSTSSTSTSASASSTPRVPPLIPLGSTSASNNSAVNNDINQVSTAMILDKQRYYQQQRWNNDLADQRLGRLLAAPNFSEQRMQQQQQSQPKQQVKVDVSSGIFKTPESNVIYANSSRSSISSTAPPMGSTSSSHSSLYSSSTTIPTQNSLSRNYIPSPVVNSASTEGKMSNYDKQSPTPSLIEAHRSSSLLRCFYCNVEGAKFECLGCESVVYCNELCQTQHWSVHVTQCPKIMPKLKKVD